MSSDDEWSPDEALGTETFRQGDVAEDEGERISPSFARQSNRTPPSTRPWWPTRWSSGSWGRSSTTPSSW